MKDFGCDVVVQHDAGAASHFRDADYTEAGARVVWDAEEVHARSDLVCQVAPVTAEQADCMSAEAAVCGFMHVGVMPVETLKRLRDRRITVLGWEAVENASGARPVRRALAEIGGLLAVQWGGHLLQVEEGGRGIVLGNIPGIAPSTFVIVGAGNAGWTAARLALAHRAHVIVLDLEFENLRRAADYGCEQVVTAVASDRNLRRYVPIADVLMCAVAARGGRTPQLVTEAMVRTMKPGSVILDLSIDEGGCVETSRPTSLDRPTFQLHGVTHFCVPNMTAAVPRTASRALSLAAAPFLVRIARRGVAAALATDRGLLRGVALHRGAVFNEHAAAALGVEPADPATLLGKGEAR
jgi:alanine dehydrogenase